MIIRQAKPEESEQALAFYYNLIDGMQDAEYPIRWVKGVYPTIEYMKSAADEGFDPFYGAPVILIVLADKSVPTHVYDGSLMMGNMMNAASSLGLGSIWIHRAKEEFETEEGKKLLADLGITGEWEGIGHCAIGYTDGEPAKAAPRKDNRVFWTE